MGGLLKDTSASEHGSSGVGLLAEGVFETVFLEYDLVQIAKF